MVYRRRDTVGSAALHTSRTHWCICHLLLHGQVRALYFYGAQHDSTDPANSPGSHALSVGWSSRWYTCFVNSCLRRPISTHESSGMYCGIGGFGGGGPGDGGAVLKIDVRHAMSPVGVGSDENRGVSDDTNFVCGGLCA